MSPAQLGVSIRGRGESPQDALGEQRDYPLRISTRLRAIAGLFELILMCLAATVFFILATLFDDRIRVAPDTIRVPGPVRGWPKGGRTAMRGSRRRSAHRATGSHRSGRGNRRDESSAREHAGGCDVRQPRASRRAQSWPGRAPGSRSWLSPRERLTTYIDARRWVHPRGSIDVCQLVHPASAAHSRPTRPAPTPGCTTRTLRLNVSRPQGSATTAAVPR